MYYVCNIFLAIICYDYYNDVKIKYFNVNILKITNMKEQKIKKEPFEGSESVNNVKCGINLKNGFLKFWSSHVINFLLIGVIAFSLIGCGKDNDEDPVVPEEPPVERGDMIVVAKLFQRQPADQIQYRVDVAKRLGANQFLIFPDQVTDYEGVSDVLNESGIDLWLIAPIFYNDNNLKSSANDGGAFWDALGRDPHWAICDDGGIAWAADGAWPRWVCPNDKEYLDLRIESFRPALRACNFTGISLDFIRYFTHWENTRPYTDPRTLRNSCFCDECINEFMESSYCNSYLKTALQNAITAGAGPVKLAQVIYNDFNYVNRWTNYKVNKIDNSVEYILAKLNSEFPNLKSNIHAVPYTNTDHNGAIKSVIGQDFNLLSRRIDQISPMTYNVMCERIPQWINDVTSDIVDVVSGRVPVVPTIQGNANVTMDVYEQIISSALKAPSSGIVIWQFERLSEERIDIIDKVLNGK